MAPPSVPSAARSFAVWSSSDLPGFGDQLLPRVIERQLSVRLPGWQASLFAPLGWTRPLVADGGVVAAPLVPTGDRTSRVADVARLSVVCPAFPVGIAPTALAELYGCTRAAAAAPLFSGGLGTRAEARHSVVWAGVRVGAAIPADMVAAADRQPYLAVRDTASRDRLRAAGVSRDISVVAHSGLLAADLAADDTLRTRRAHLRQFGFLPADGEFVVVAPGERALTVLPELARPVADVAAELGVDHVVFMPTAPVDATPEGVSVLPANLVLEDRLAVLAGARLVIAIDEHVAAACAGLGVRWVLLDLGAAGDEPRPAVLEFGYAKQITTQPAKLGATARAAGALPARKAKVLTTLAEHFDRLAAIAENVLAAHGADAQRGALELAAENEALRAAHTRIRQRAFTDRQRLIEPLVEAMRARDAAEAELERMRVSQQRLAHRLAEYEQQIQAWQNTKLVRWSRPLRDAYGKLRAW